MMEMLALMAVVVEAAVGVLAAVPELPEMRLRRPCLFARHRPSEGSGCCSAESLTTSWRRGCCSPLLNCGVAARCGTTIR